MALNCRPESCYISEHQVLSLCIEIRSLQVSILNVAPLINALRRSNDKISPHDFSRI